MSLKFDDLLAAALLEWPVEIDLAELGYSDLELTRYMVKELPKISDVIEGRHIGTVDEIIMRNLHSAIDWVLHDVAAYTTRIRMSDLRAQAIQIKLERKIKECMEEPDLGYLPEDVELGRRYFAENGGSQAG